MNHSHDRIDSRRFQRLGAIVASAVALISLSFATFVFAPVASAQSAVGSKPTEVETVKDAVIVGTRIGMTSDGAVQAVRFYKPDAGAHWYTAYLVDAAGSQRAKVTAKIAASQVWIDLPFKSPVAVKAGEKYVAAIKFRTGSSYAYTPDAFGSGTLLSSGHIALAGVAGKDATSLATSTSSSDARSDFCVDVVFTGGAASIPKPNAPQPSVTPSASGTATPSTSATPGASGTATPSTSVTASPNVPPVSGVVGFPDASNTGVPSGVRLTPSGSLTVTQDGAVIDGLYVRGTITVQADDVVIRNTKVEVSTATSPILVVAGSTGTLIERVEVDGLDGAGQGINFKQGASGGTIRYANIHGGEDGIRISADNTTVESSYVHHLQRRDGGHHDTIQIRAGDDVSIKGNNLQVYVPETKDPMNAAIQIGSLVGSDTISNLRVVGNLMNGGNVTVNGGGRGEVESAVYSQNRFGRDFRYSVQGNVENSVWEATNVYFDNGQVAR